MNGVAYPQFSADGVPITYVPNPFSADGKPADGQWKTPVRVHTTDQIALSGLQTVDGVALMEGDRVLVKDQILPEENGIYVASAYSWRRALDCYLWEQFPAAVVGAQEGASPGDAVFVCDAAGAGTVGVTPNYWVAVAATAGSLATFTPLRAIVSGPVGVPTASPTTSQEIAYLSGITQPVQSSLAALNSAVSSALTIAVTGTNLATALGDKYVRTTRFYSIGAGTAGAVPLPANSIVVLDDFGGATDAVIATMESGRPTFNHAHTTSGAVVTTAFDSGGNYALSGAPSGYPVALVYRVRQKLSQFDSTSSDIVGEFDLEQPLAYQVINVSAGTTFVQTSPALLAFMVDTSAGNAVVILPDATGWSGVTLHVKKITPDGNTVVVYSATGTQTIDLQTRFTITDPMESLKLLPDNMSWFIV